MNEAFSIQTVNDCGKSHPQNSHEVNFIPLLVNLSTVPPILNSIYFSGRIRGMQCRPIYEPSEPRNYNWHDNFICVPPNSPYNFDFLNFVPHFNYKCRCVQWHSAKDPHTWKDNFLCDWNVSCPL